MTKNEIKAIQGILDSDFHDGAPPVGNPVWSWSANPFESKRTFSGVVASLSKKGYVITNGVSGDDACVTLTQAGFDTFNAEKGTS